MKVSAHDRVRHFAGRAARNGTLAVQRLVKGHAERVLIASSIGPMARMLFRRHVCGCADARIGACRRGVQWGALCWRNGGEREPEVHDANAAVVSDEDVRGFEVAMDDPRGMRRAEPPPRLSQDIENFGPVSRLPPQPRAQRDAIDELEGDKDLGPKGPDFEDGDDVRMRQSRERLPLFQ